MSSTLDHFRKSLFILAFLWCPLHATDYAAEIKGGYFIPTSSLFQDIYGGGGIYSLEVSRSVCPGIDGWASASYFTQLGYSIGQQDSTRVTLVPLGLGVKAHYCLKQFRTYAGLGIEANYLHTRDQSPLVIQSVSKWGVGAIAKAGVLFNFCPRWGVDIFGDYSFCEIPFHNTGGGRVGRQTADVSGFSVGIGVNYRFGCD